MKQFFNSGWPALAGLAGALLLSSRAQAQSTRSVMDQATVLPALATPGNGSILNLVEYVDAQGNTYQAGSFTGTVHFGRFAFSAEADAEVVVAKRNAAGVYQWAVSGGGAGEQRCKALAVDAAGGVYLAGSFSSATARFGTTVLTNAQAANTSTSDLFVSKVNADGRWQWAVSAGGGTRVDGNDYATALAADALGSVYVAGTFTSSVASFGTIRVPSPDPNGRDIAFVAKLTSTGQWSWVRHNADFGSTVTSVTADGSGNAYLSGDFRGRVHYGPFLVPSSNRSQAVYIAKVDATGNWQWVTAIQPEAGTTGSVQHFGLVLDGRGHAYTTGIFSCDTLRFGRTALVNSGARRPPAYVTHTDDAFLAKLDVATGRWRWAVQSRGSGDETIGLPLFTPTGQLWVGGIINEPAETAESPSGNQFGATTLFSAGGNDIMIAQLDTAGQWQWARRAGGPDNEGAVPCRFDAQGRVYLRGAFHGNKMPLGAFTLSAAPSAWGSSGAAYSTFESRLASNALLAGREENTMSFAVYPNPAHASITVTGLQPGQAVQVLDMVGRRVLGGTMPLQGDLRLTVSPGLPTGVYLVRAGTQARRLVVE